MGTRDECTGCMACRFVCPRSAIDMSENAEGFLYPRVNKDQCIDCGLCDKVCPIENPIDYDHLYAQEYYAARMRDRKERLECQSGGICDVFSKEAIAGGKGIVYGVGFDDEWNAIHKRAATAEEADEFRGSKYVQSDVEKVYRSIIDDIKNEGIQRIVVFGTACQIAGVKKFLEQKRQPIEKVIFVDIICHGVPSPKIWREYLDAEGKRVKLTSLKFRDKRFGWSSHVESFMYGRKTTHSERFTRFFHMEVINRKCCAICKYASYNRESDITVGDFWGYEKAGLDYDSYGISECLINTAKGNKFFSSCLDKLEVAPITKEQADQWNLNHPTVVDTVKRDEFWGLYQDGGYIAVRDAYCGDVIKRERKNSVFYRLKAIKRFFTGR